jgi:hypothetical protein
VHSEVTWHRRRLRRQAKELCSDDRLVDYGVLLYTVRQDPSGIEIRHDGPRVVRVREPELFGGIYDTRLHEWYDESPNPVVWLVSEQQRQLILHGDDLPLQVICEGGEGAGKTTGVLARWNILRAIEHAGDHLEFGLVAPVGRRLARSQQALVAAMPAEWYSYRERDGLFTFHLGHSLRLLSAHQQSEADGSPIQSFDWAGGSGDEAQDMLHVIEDIRSRGRRAAGGRYPMMLTATVKGLPAYRSFRDKWSKTKDCGIVSLSGFANPYVAPAFWEARKHQLTPREYDRRVLAKDVGPERATYPSWDRQHNLRPVPQIGAEDITASLLVPWGQRFGMLGGHDPGTLFDVTILLRAYRVAGMRKPAWWVVGELTTERTTTEQHVKDLLTEIRGRWRLNEVDWRGKPAEDGRRLFVRADPYSESGNDSKQPDKSVYATFRQKGITILPAAMKTVGLESKVARVPREGRIEMVNTLLCNAAFERRLFVDCDEFRQPRAPKLVAALESSERDTDGKAETQKKNEDDLSHWPAALGYALWSLEKPRIYVEEEAAK